MRAKLNDPKQSMRRLWDRLKSVYLPKGIHVCEKWLVSSEAFFNEVGTRPTIYHYLKLRDVSLGYVTGNTYWHISDINVFLALNHQEGDVIKNIREWCETFDILTRIVYGRYKGGLTDIHECLTSPLYAHVRPRHEERVDEAALRKREIRKKSALKHPDTHKKCWQAYNKGERIVGVRKRYMKKRRQTDTSYNISMRIRCLCANALKRAECGKSNRTEILMGATWPRLKLFLENTMTEGMTWDRYHAGEIHIDHIKPLSQFDFVDIPQQRACFHFTNLQLLWASDNLRKSDNYDGDGSRINVLAQLDERGHVVFPTITCRAVKNCV